MFSNRPYNDKDIDKLSHEAALKEFIASDAGLKYYAKEAITLNRELTDWSDEEIFDEIISASPDISKSEEEILAELLGLS